MQIRKRLAAWLTVALTALLLQYLMLALGQLLSGGLTLQTLWQAMVNRWTTAGDSPRYLDIAQNGYVRTGENAINLVFYPLYPLLIRGFSWLTGSLAVSGVIISQVCFAASCVVLYEMMLLERCERAEAWLAVLLLNLYPFSAFVMGVFSEGLFLLLTMLCMLLLRKKRFAAAGAVGFLAALTRVQGMLLFFPALYEAYACVRAKERRVRDTLPMLLIPLGFVVYLGINWALHGDCLKFLAFEANEPWYQTTQWVGRNISTQYDLAVQYPGLSMIIYAPQIALYFAAGALILGGVLRGERLSYSLYALAYLGFTYLSGWMISGGRYMMACFPLFMQLARVREGFRRNALLMLFVLLGVAYHTLYYAGFAIM